MTVLDELPGFRRRFRITPTADRVHTAVEDDYHCMAVTVHHQRGVATAVEPEMIRSPWTTCPGAVEMLRREYAGVALDDFARQGEKTQHCTHLHDLLLLGAAHADDAQPLVYDILVSDPADDGIRDAEIRLNGDPVLTWREGGFHIQAPDTIAGTRLDKLGPWLASLDTQQQQEAARLLRWGNMIAHGRSRPIEQQSDATKLPPNCYSFQPDRARRAKRVGEIRDFSRIAAQPLDQPQAAP